MRQNPRPPGSPNFRSDTYSTDNCKARIHRICMDKGTEPIPPSPWLMFSATAYFYTMGFGKIS